MTLEQARVLLKTLNNQVTSAFYDGDFWVEEGTFEAFEVADAALRGSQPDPETGLVLCGCGGKAILFHQPDIEGPGSDGDRWAVFCEKTCGMGTSDMTSPEYAVETWNTGMGYTAPPLPGAIVPAAGEMAPNGDEGAEE